MKTTTTWQFRKENLSYYRKRDFKSDWDYFIYLHLNDSTRRLHLWGTLVGVALFPWAMYRFFAHLEIIPMIIFTFFYYGTGFMSHYTCDGQISETWRDLMKTYKYAVKMNLLGLRGKWRAEENHFIKTYPKTLWVYSVALRKPSVTPPAESHSKYAEPQHTHSL